ncbi:hypothetical protein WN943_018555 [Citrus x changshan-huyou]
MKVKFGLTTKSNGSGPANKFWKEMQHLDNLESVPTLAGEEMRKGHQIFWHHLFLYTLDHLSKKLLQEVRTDNRMLGPNIITESVSK